MGDEDSPQNQMFQRIWGGGFNYRWAFVDNYCIYSIGGNADKKIREMIDQVKSGHPKKIGSEMKAALDMIPQSKHAEAVGTFNYVRLLDLMPKMMPVTDREDLSKLKVPSESNIAFACGFDNGNATMQIAVPKKHLLEIKTAFKTLIPQIKKQEELQRQRQREKSNLFNGKDLSGWHVDVPKMDNDPDVKSPFIVRNGMLVSLGTPNGHLITDAVHQNYRLEVQYRFPAKPGNCGVLVHASTPRALYQCSPSLLRYRCSTRMQATFGVSSKTSAYLIWSSGAVLKKSGV
jgi:hypothetical protein